MAARRVRALSLTALALPLALTLALAVGAQQYRAVASSPALPLLHLANLSVVLGTSCSEAAPGRSGGATATATACTRVERRWADTGGQLTVQDGFVFASPAAGGRRPRAAATQVPQRIGSRVWVANVFLGVEYNITGVRIAETQPNSTATDVTVAVRSPMLASEGAFEGVEVHRLAVLANGTLRYSVASTTPASRLDVWLTRASESALPPAPEHRRHPSRPPARDSTERATARAPAPPTPTPAPTPARNNVSFALNLTDGWALNSTVLQLNAMAISLQGVSNRDAARLYLTYPPGWAFSYTAQVHDYLASPRHGVVFQELASPMAALTALRAHVRGYVLWDATVRESLVVAFTVAGLEDAVVATKAQEPALRALGLACVEDLSTRFRGQSPVQVYGWARAKYWARCSRAHIVWLGGECHNAIQPGVADFGVSQRAFFTDLSTREADEAEYALASGLLAGMAPQPLVLGWHSYCKDFEHTFTALASRHGGRVHGLDTNPNLSFTSKIPLSKGFRFRNRHSNNTGVGGLQDKVYIALVQTDGLGLGSWTKPGRGQLPYAWEVTLPDLWLQPVLVQMFYEQATNNDFFVAALSGPGYMYPRATPPALLPALLGQAAAAMAQLDLHSLVIFDASNATGPHTVTGDTTLPPEVVEAYMTAMPNALGFLNGYAPTFSFAHRASPAGNQSLISFDYYLDPGRSVAEAVQDLQQLAALNPVRPYFLPVHVREFSTIGKVAEIVQALDPSQFEVIAIDKFMTWANYAPSFRH